MKSKVLAVSALLLGLTLSACSSTQAKKSTDAPLTTGSLQTMVQLNGLGAVNVTQVKVSIASSDPADPAIAPLVLTAGSDQTFTGTFQQLRVGSNGGPTYNLTAEATDANGMVLFRGAATGVVVTGQVMATVVIVANSTAPVVNDSPVISAMALSAAKIVPQTSVDFTVTASDTDGDALTYTFSHGTCDGTLSGGAEGTPQTANVITFKAGNTLGPCQLKVVVTDSRGLTATGMATLDVEPPRFIVTPTAPVFLSNVAGVAGDGAPGFDAGSIKATGVPKAELYFTPSSLFGHAVTLGDVARMSYWTKKGTTHVVDVHDWFLVIYTTPYAGQPGWYGARIGAEAYLAANLTETANAWNQWSTDGQTNQLRFFESTYNYFGSSTDPSWTAFVAGSSLTGTHTATPVPYAGQEILYFSVQTASSATGFDGQLDGVRIELKDGSVVEIDMQPSPINVPTHIETFDSGTGDWVAAQGISTATANGNSYAVIQNKPDGYQAGYGDAGYSFFGGKGTTYQGDFYQALDVYIDVSWAPAALAYDASFWIDMTPNHTDPNNYGAEHNFHLTATGSAVNVTADGATNEVATITQTGWYTFLMTFKKAASPTDPVLTDMVVLDAANIVVGQATTPITATSPGGPFLSSDLLGNGYVWLTLWQNGFAGDTLKIDNVRTGLLPY